MQHLVEASIVSPLLSPRFAYQYSQPAAVAIAWAVAAALLADATNPVHLARLLHHPPTSLMSPPSPPYMGFFTTAGAPYSRARTRRRTTHRFLGRTHPASATHSGRDRVAMLVKRAAIEHIEIMATFIGC